MNCNTLAISFAFDPISIVSLAIWKLKNAQPMVLVIFEIALVSSSISLDPYFDAYSFILFPLSIVGAAIWKGILA